MRQEIFYVPLSLANSFAYISLKSPGLERSPCPMALAITERASRNNILGSGTAILCKRNQMLACALQQPRLPGVKSVSSKDFVGAFVPHGESAIKTAAILFCEGERTRTNEGGTVIGHKVFH
jgi:hypothetical protein